MKHILVILLSIVSVTVYSQSPRIKLNQITKDNAVGSILISSPTDSGMVYSRDFFINFGTDTTLVLFGDTIGGGISTVVTDLITIQGDGSVATPLYVDTSVINTIQGMIDTLTARGYLAITQLTDTLNANTRGFLTAEVDGSVTNEGALTVQAGGSNDSQIQSNTSGSTNVTIAGGSNVTVTESGNTITIASTASGGGSIPVDTFVTIAGIDTITGAKTFTSDLNVDAKIALNDGGNSVFIGDDAGRVDDGNNRRNVGIGYQALYSNTTGERNTANGYQALFANTTGNYNVANGYAALRSNTTGNYNTANGYQALYSNTTGYQNTVNGYQALYSNTTGNNNTANGLQSLYSNTTGNANVANGLRSLHYNTTGNNNVANGFRALYSLSSGSNNQAYGYEAGRYLSNGSTALTTADGSLFIGSNTKASANGNTNEIVIGTNAIGNGNNSVTIGASTNELVVMKGRMELNDGGNSVFIGDDAGRVDDGNDRRNVGVGYQVLYNNTTGSYNVANGYQVLHLNTSGSTNIANGSFALYSNTSGFQNIAQGYQALYNNTTGNNNVAVGYRALYNNSVGYYNVANGLQALYNNSGGVNNVANGSLALYNLSSGSNNQAYGTDAGRYLSDGSTPLTNANSSLFIGSNTKASADSNSNEIVIGTNAIGNGSNTITIGASTTQSLHTRNYEFDIDQTVGATEDNYVLTYDNADGQISLEPATGGTATIPVDTFVTIAGTETITGAKTFTSDIVVQNEESNTNAAELNLYKKNGSSSGEVTVNDNIGNINFKAENGATTVTSASIEVDATTLYNNQIGGDILFKTASNFHSRPLTEAMRIDKLGYVGINTSSPSENLDVNGNGRFRSIGSGASAGALHYTSTGVLTTNTSDARLKTNLQPLENTLNKLLNINTYTFNWINETNRVDLGMVAQEVEQIFPNLVFTNSVDGYKGIHYDKFSSILTKAIQEQQAIIETQQQKITDLETTIQALITRIETLENQ